MLQHYVVLKYQPETPESHINEFIARMRTLEKEIEHVKYLEIGRDELKEGRSWDLILIMKFESLDSLRAYQEHPKHQDIMRFNGVYVDNIAAIDYTI
ncbi:Dabb family protein [Marinomonas mediterranea]|jgi:Stress responsive A/B Barrel Domain.|uniref:Stress responsive alpha-beta barrel domain-containing protein n=1 Tax=Marinomonas mediterranea (strain ATCC 700492 / JCM 21426 / NBRC 103028 / MMB-1) TaxID=717774 RepID=F2JY65_MARM1|nr:Dabb family protein [Marinomonas mediterranea]ADZ90801.1 Stress responsive alpha-beta barrel domain-containing protein [Marinomonas mediterranea MMB-1]WCN16954.1 Dabb family protein [Marinomonas mediterranea MMB-1]